MQIFHEVMNWFYVGLMVGAIGIGAWFYKKKKESDR
jgi:LPXTG-motif cell wall-anchored protein